jgi:hypothetical protein
MKFRGGEFSTGTTGNFQSELTLVFKSVRYQPKAGIWNRICAPTYPSYTIKSP